MNVYLLVLFIVICIGAVGSGLIYLDYLLERKIELYRFCQEDEKEYNKREYLLPEIQTMIEELLDECLQKTMDKTVEMAKRMYNDD